MSKRDASEDRLPINETRIPAAFLWLGAGGLIPFVAGALALWFGPPIYRGPALFWLTGYTMVILSFVGALHWGVAMTAREVSMNTRAMAAAWSVVPALVAWGSLHFASSVGFVVMAATFLVQLAMDHWLAARFPVPAWFLKLRTMLTAGVVASLFVAYCV